MKVVAAIDSFKGSMTSMEAGNAVKKGILAAKPDAEVWLSPLADGGEGTVDALIEGLGAEKIPVTVAGPLGEKVSCYYGFLEETKTAVMEMASAAGITLVIKKDPLRASTYGVGEMIADALKRGCKNFMIGIGGSATNDGGIGMLKALGFEFFDEDGNDVGEGAAALAKIEVIRTENKNSLLSGAKFQIACDVKNPLCGKQGATYIFGPQKGVTEEQKSKVDEAMKHYADVTKESLGCDFADCEGAGAAGGLGYAFLSYLAGELIPGVELILQATGLEEKMKKAAAELEFEQAAEYRDLIENVKRIGEKQKINDTGGDDRDIIAMAKAGDEAVVAIFFIRSGKLLDDDLLVLEEPVI